jgi:hypothetical protein
MVIVEDEVDDEVIVKNLLNIRQHEAKKILQLSLRMIKIQKMSFRAKRSEAKNSIIHL